MRHSGPELFVTRRCQNWRGDANGIGQNGGGDQCHAEQRTAGLPSQIPQPPSENQPTEANPLDVVLTIARDRSMQINSQPVEPQDLEARLRVAFASRPSGVLFVEGVRELEFADVVSVIDTARGAGVGRIGIITQREAETQRP